ncbi:hypothetical protein PHMEG_00025856 [Phytophthora megakarya]|uniref:Uncharacterized protein n=1 Tax=Phytophthora megakarya TaxID=4795 RepID=A0A225VB52_9STRA|nr:hypothetical protein PHMEG_00025856 [Phytophthora megakarya]
MYDCITNGISAGRFLDENCPVNNISEVRSSNYEYCCLLHTTSTIQCAPEDLILSNLNFIDSGATIDAISPEFCSSRLIDHHGVEMPITLANQQEMSVPKRTVRLRLVMDSFPTNVNDFLVLPIPEKCDVLLGMPWLKPTNPDINWIEETVKPRVESGNKDVNKPKTPKKKRINPRIVNIPSSKALKIGGKRFAVAGSTINAGTRYFHHGFYSTITGETKYMTSKQFRRTLKKPERFDCVFVVRPVTEKEQMDFEKAFTEVEAYHGLPVYPVLLRHKENISAKITEVFAT